MMVAIAAGSSHVQQDTIFSHGPALRFSYQLHRYSSKAARVEYLLHLGSWYVIQKFNNFVYHMEQKKVTAMAATAESF